MFKNRNFYLSILILSLMIILAIFPSRYAPIAFEGILLWATLVLPAVFPYLILTALLTKLNALSFTFDKADKLARKLTRTSGISLYAFIISVFSGYPVGAKTLAELYENKLIGKDEATRMSAICSTASPAFVLGAVGGIMLENTTFGVVIFISHLLSAILSGFIFRFYGKTSPIKLQPLKTKNSENIIYESVYSSVISVLMVGGVITICYVLVNILLDFHILSPFIYLLNLIFHDENLAKGVVVSLIEATNGVKIIAATTSSLKAPIIAAALSFGGLSIITQSMAFLKKTGEKTAVFLSIKSVQAVLSFIIAYVILLFF